MLESRGDDEEYSPGVVDENVFSLCIPILLTRFQDESAGIATPTTPVY